MSKPTTKQICESFQDCIERGDNIDIYQMCAVAWRIASDRWVARFYYFKACICFVFQTTMLSLMVYQFSRENIRLTLNGEHPNQQDMSQIGERYHLITKSIAFVASAWISVNVWSWLKNLEKQSLYRVEIRDFANCPVYVNHTFVAMGLLVNFFTLFVALIGNNIVIYFAQNALEVILNCVAIFWLFEIDNQLIGPNDYQTMQQWLTDFIRRSENMRKSNHESEMVKELENRCRFNCGCLLCCCGCSSSGGGCVCCGAEEERRASMELHAQTSTVHGDDNGNEEEEEPKTAHSAQPSNTQSEIDDTSVQTVSTQTTSNSCPANEDTNEQKQTEEDEEHGDNNKSGKEILVEIPLSKTESEEEASTTANSNGVYTCSNHASCVGSGRAKETCVSRSLFVVIGILEVFTLCGTVIAPTIIFVLSFVV